ncbi:MAG: tRNA (N(6)-L-threonylcarbamoyladenosine(37)-C(2))-methylthiotransferase MtaB, partial [Hyphomicrobiales bacterium]|nr:tRNA (N(6)-L-threonylcarbamoyladenosine(37)-C(2))-methylthiotransferase MtaB [Hyphomicrobiales bacterium]
MNAAAPIEIATFGCRLNIAETRAIREAASAALGGPAAIVNSCAVTAQAARDAMKAVRRLRRAAPDRPVFVTGCASEVASAAFLAAPGVAGIVANVAKGDASAWREAAARAGIAVVARAGAGDPRPRPAASRER